MWRDGIFGRSVVASPCLKLLKLNGLAHAQKARQRQFLDHIYDCDQSYRRKRAPEHHIFGPLATSWHVKCCRRTTRQEDTSGPVPASATRLNRRGTRILPCTPTAGCCGCGCGWWVKKRSNPTVPCPPLCPSAATARRSPLRSHDARVVVAHDLPVDYSHYRRVCRGEEIPGVRGSCKVCIGGDNGALWLLLQQLVLHYCHLKACE